MNIYILFAISILMALNLFESYGYNDANSSIQITRLDVRSIPADIKIDGTGDYKQNSWIEIGKAPLKHDAFTFVGWKVDDKWVVGNPISVLMNTDHTAVAIYQIHPEGKAAQPYDVPSSENVEKYSLTIISPYGKTSGEGHYNKGDTVRFSITERIVYDEFRDGVRYVFDSWDSGSSPNLLDNSIIMKESATVKANWIKQYRIDIINTDPDAKIMGGGWSDEDSLVSLVATTNSENEKTRLGFKQWISIGTNGALISDPSSPITQVKLEQPYIVMPQWEKQFYVDVNSRYGTVQGDGFYNANTHAPISLDTELVNAGDGKTRYKFVKWEGENIIGDGPQVKIFVDEPKSVTAKWAKEFYLTVNSEYGIPFGSDWYDEGQVASFGITMPRNPSGMWSEHIFYGWEGVPSGSTSGSILMSGPKIVTAYWQEDHSIAVINIIIIAAVSGAGFVIFKKFKKPLKKITT